MTQKIYLSPAVTDVISNGLKELKDEIKTLRRGHELFNWENEVDPIDSEEE